MTRSDLKHGDFTGLAENYSKYRPGYAPSVRDALLGMLNKPAKEVVAADVGAGTGIWTRLLAEKVQKVVAVEPNDDMRRFGQADSQGLSVEFHAGSGEETGLPANAFDMVSMASSFHWVDFNRGLQEFHRILRPDGRFVALWNPRLIEANPVLVEIEAEIARLKPVVKRVSSGASGITETLTEQLNAHPLFTDVVYVEGRHVSMQTPEHYLGVWRSVNDVRFQLGEENWAKFLNFVEQKIAKMDSIVTVYKTRAWSARRR